MIAPPPRRTRQAFTLLEILMVMVIIALLVALLFVVISPARRQSKEVVCLSNLRQMYISTQMYREEIEKCRLTPDKIRTLLRDAPLRIKMSSDPQIKLEADFPVDRRTTRVGVFTHYELTTSVNVCTVWGGACVKGLYKFTSARTAIDTKRTA